MQKFMEWLIEFIVKAAARVIKATFVLTASTAFFVFSLTSLVLLIVACLFALFAFNSLLMLN